VKAESNVMPQAYAIDKIGEQAVITFAENVTEIVIESETKYEYDSYSMVVPYRTDIAALVEEDYQAWIDSAKAIEPAPAKPTIEECVATIEETIDVLFGGE